MNFFLRDNIMNNFWCFTIFIWLVLMVIAIAGLCGVWIDLGINSMMMCIFWSNITTSIGFAGAVLLGR